MDAEEIRPALTRSSTGSSKKSSLTLDLSNLPPLVQPTPPSNTLLFTSLQSIDIFRPENLQTIRELVSKTAPIHAWAPLKSFRRIVVSFFDEEAAIRVRAVWDGEAILGERCRVYFGQPTPIDTAKDTHLALPDAGKLFFISPPPSPPHGWEMRLEDAPNKMVHADDLAEALAKLRHQGDAVPGGNSPISPADSKGDGGFGSRQRSRSSTLIFQPTLESGSTPDLPCVTVDDMTDMMDEPEEWSGSPFGALTRPIMAHTSRPPVELMQDA
ncbi:Calcipressin-domain-containing protein [Thozetella sp. PMI_491]|nr:Calcipressin-domain-containing protein [Thozetella sp. PMI_491]